MNYGVIDIGSNTIRLNVYDEDNLENAFFSRKSVAGLASYVEDGDLSERGIQKLIKVLNRNKDILRYLPVKKTYLFATASLRNVGNRKDVLRCVKKNTGYDIELISQREEARLGYLAASKTYDFNEGVTIDIGGASTEVVSFKKDKVREIFNLEEGCLSLFSQYVDAIIPDAEEYEAVTAHMENLVTPLTSLSDDNDTVHAIGLGGTVRAIGNVLQDYHQWEDNDCYALDDIMDMQRKIVDRDKKLLKIIPQVVPERIHTVATGSIILSTIMKKNNVNVIHVSENGLREGYLIDKLRGAS